MPENCIYVGRPTKWGNPVKPGDVLESGRVLDAATCVTFFDVYCGDNAAFDYQDIRAELGGKDLACWCKLDKPCHADVLLDIANNQVN